MVQGPEFATLEAEQLLRDRAITNLPVDPRAIAVSVDVQVVEKPATAGVSGMLIRSGNSFAIAYATNVASEGFRRFSIGHELGHYFLRGHVDHVLSSDGVHESRAGFTSRDRYEREADQFAVGLLMPRAPFTREMAKAGEGLTAVEHLAKICVTSLSATAIRYAELADAPVAVMVSNQDDVEYCCLSKPLREMGAGWIQRGTPIPRGTSTYALSGDPSRILQADRAEGATRLDRWFDGGPDVSAYEEVIGLGNYGKILTVITLEEEVEEEEAEEDEVLARSWTPTFQKSRRR